MIPQSLLGSYGSLRSPLVQKSAVSRAGVLARLYKVEIAGQESLHTYLQISHLGLKIIITYIAYSDFPCEDFIYFSKQGVGAEGEGQSDCALSMEPDVGLNLLTLRS